MHLHSYPKVYNLGHPAIENLLDGPVTIEEKIDGSQFSFAATDDGPCFRSRNADIVQGAPGMFQQAVDVVGEISHLLNPGWIYRGEFLSKPKHNSLHYSRTPERSIMLWDIETDKERYMGRAEKEEEASRIGLELVPLMSSGKLDSMEMLDRWLETESVLGGTKIEGVVIKNYARFGRDGKMLAGKYVSEAFKETNRVDFRDRNPKQGDILTILGEFVRSEARWRKAVERYRDMGKLENDPRDIGMLIKGIQSDIMEECEPEIVKRLLAWASPQLMRKSIAGFPEWYKRQLAETQFEVQAIAKATGER